MTDTPRPDASMDLLRQVQETALEPTYSRQDAPSPIWRLVVVMLVAALVTTGVVSLKTWRVDSDVQQEQLTAQIGQARQRSDELATEQAKLQEEIRQVQQALDLDEPTTAEIARLERVVGAVALTGPGVKVIVSESDVETIYDRDLSMLVSGLFQAGAEAIAINGRRISSQTAIRSAGAAITVDYVSLNPPYIVEAIGDPRTLQAGFAQTSASNWWQFLHNNYDVSFEMGSVDEISMPADPGLRIDYTKR